MASEYLGNLEGNITFDKDKLEEIRDEDKWTVPFVLPMVALARAALLACASRTGAGDRWCDMSSDCSSCRGRLKNGRH